MNRLVIVPVVLLGFLPVAAHAEEAEEAEEADLETDAPAGLGYTDPPPEPRLVTSGYLDVGFADADGNGTSFVSGDTHLPADYRVDAFAPAVNSRGEAASTDAGGRFTNGFLPRSAGIGGKPSLLLNTVSVDTRFSTPGDRLMVFVRAQALPRFEGSEGNHTDLLIEQAFGRFLPFASQELAVTIGKADSVFGIEYLENQANLRTGITPSLLARYTTAPSTGIKAFYRVQVAPLWSAISLNAAATNGGTMVEALQTPNVSVTGKPVVSGRLGWDLNLPGFQLKLGGSGSIGPRNDQTDPDVEQRLLGADARIHVAGLSLAGEWVDVREDAGLSAAKLTGQGPAAFASGFWARGFYATLAYRLGFAGEVLRAITPYLRVERRRAQFEDFGIVESRRLTAGARVDLGDNVALKGEWLFNREAADAPTVDNDVKVLSAVFSF